MIANPESFSAHRSILITGCSSGIGLSAAHIMRGRNWRVFPTARNQADVDGLSNLGFEAFRLDYEDPDSIEATASEVLHRTDGALSAVFSNGAYAVPGALEDLPTEVIAEGKKRGARDFIACESELLRTDVARDEDGWFAGTVMPL